MENYIKYLMLAMIVLFLLSFIIGYWYKIMYGINYIFRSKDGMCQNGFHFYNKQEISEDERLQRFAYEIISKHKCDHCEQVIIHKKYHGNRYDANTITEVLKTGRFWSS